MVCGSVLQCVAVCCSVLQRVECVAVYSSVVVGFLRMSTWTAFGGIW